MSPNFDSFPKERPVGTEKCVIRQRGTELILVNTDMEELAVSLVRQVEIWLVRFILLTLPRDQRSNPALGLHRGMMWREPRHRSENLLPECLALPSLGRIFDLHSVPVQVVRGDWPAVM